MKTPLLPRIARILRQHVGRDNVVTSREIARRLGRHEPHFQREIRRVIASGIETLWDDDLAVIAVPGGGYYVADDLEQFQAYREYLDALRLTLARKISSLDRLCRRRGLVLTK